MAPRFDPQGAANFSFPSTGSKVCGAGRARCAMRVTHPLPRGPCGWAGRPVVPSVRSCGRRHAGGQMERGGGRAGARVRGGWVTGARAIKFPLRGRAEPWGGGVPGRATCGVSGARLPGGPWLASAVGRCGPARPVGARRSRRAGEQNVPGPVACASVPCRAGLRRAGNPTPRPGGAVQSGSCPAFLCAALVTAHRTRILPCPMNDLRRTIPWSTSMQRRSGQRRPGSRSWAHAKRVTNCANATGRCCSRCATSL